MRLRPTWFGWKAAGFYAALVAAFLAIPYANLFFLLLAFLTVVALLTPWWTARNLAGVRGRILSIEPAIDGIGALVHVELDAGRRTRLGLAWELKVGKQREAFLGLAVASGLQTLSARLEPRSRGVYAIDQATLTSTSPFGFLRARRPIDAPAEIIVTPRPVAPGDVSSPAAALASLGLGSAGPGSTDPTGLREYRFGDDPRRIHWRASARGRGLVVKETEGDLARGIEVNLDRRCALESFEEALGQIVWLARLALEREEPLVLVSQGHRETYGTGHRPHLDLSRWLAQAQALPANAPATPSGSPHVLRLPIVGARP